MFHCRATSYGSQRNLKYFWLRVNKLDKVIIHGATIDTLLIGDIRHDDDGTMYQCGATNENDTTLSTIGRINGMCLTVQSTFTKVFTRKSFPYTSASH